MNTALIIKGIIYLLGVETLAVGCIKAVGNFVLNKLWKI